MLLNIHPAHRSTLLSIQLLAVVKSTHLKKYGIDAVLEPSIRDLHTLGTSVSYCSYSVGMCVCLFVCACLCVCVCLFVCVCVCLFVCEGIKIHYLLHGNRVCCMCGAHYLECKCTLRRA